MSSAPSTSLEIKDRQGAEGKGQSSWMSAFLSPRMRHARAFSSSSVVVVSTPLFWKSEVMQGYWDALCRRGKKCSQSLGWGSLGACPTRKWWSPWARGTQMRPPVLRLVWLLCECMSAGSSSCLVLPAVSISNRGGLPWGGADRVDAKGSPFLSYYSWVPKPLG